MIDNREEKEAEVNQYSQSNCLISTYQENVFPPEVCVEKNNVGVGEFANTQGNNVYSSFLGCFQNNGQD